MIAAVGEPEWPDDVALVVAGDGPLRDSCRQAHDGKRFRYLGRVPHSDVPPLLRGALASLSVQTSEGGRVVVGCSPIKVYEGLASGRPVIVSDIPGVGEVVASADAGIVVPTGDAAALAGAVAQLSANREQARQMGNRARASAVRDHSWVERARVTARLLKQLVDQSPERKLSPDS